MNDMRRRLRSALALSLLGAAVLIPIDGAASVAEHRPWNAMLSDGVWTVRGTLPWETIGGTAVVMIAKNVGRIVSVFHEQ